MRKVPRPIHVIEFILAATLLLYGLYNFLPWAEHIPANIMFAAFDEDLHDYLNMLICVIPPTMLIYSCATGTEKFRSVSLFLTTLSYLSIAILRLLLFGLSTPFWIFTLSLALLSGVCYVFESRSEASE